MYIAMQDRLMQTVSKYENGEMGILDALCDLRQNREEMETALEIIKEFEDCHTDDIALAASACDGHHNGYRIEVRQGR